MEILIVLLLVAAVVCLGLEAASRHRNTATGLHLGWLGLALWALAELLEHVSPLN